MVFRKADLRVGVRLVIRCKPDVGSGSAAQGYCLWADRSGRCDEAWDILWPLVETGNSEAAALLLVDMVANFGPPIHFNSDDEVINFFGFLLVASIGFVVTEGDGEMFNFGTLRKEGLGGIWPGNDGMRAVCVAANPPESCIDYAFEKTLVLDAEEVGALLEAGLRDGATVTCFERGW